jgi:predicted Zn finger-like uncharacterized protein
LGAAYRNKEMPIVTACPECSTQFIVTKDQLNAFEGQVRCGTCHHVFNANDHLIKAGSSKKTVETQVESVLSEVSLNEDEPIEHIEITSDAPLEEDTQEETAQNDSIVDVITTPSIVNDLSIDEKFNHYSTKRPFSWAVFFLCFVLLLALILQLTYFLRTEISANYPQIKPWLTKACKQIGCRIDLPKKIEMLTIDDSDIQEHMEYENVLIFSSTLSNHANVAQAYPLIELVLTNTDDEPIIRRTFSANEYLPKGTQIENGIGAKEDIRIKLNINTVDTAVAGYRVSIHY